MDSVSYLSAHDSGLGRALGISFPLATATRVVAEMELRPEHFTRPDVVHGGIIMALADSAGAYGAVLNLPDASSATATIESKTNFLQKGKGRELRAESSPLHVGRTVSVWRTSVYRGSERPVAEVTQTQIVLEDRTQKGKESKPPELETVSPEAVEDGRFEQAGANVRRAVADERQRQIFEGACRVISEKGFSKATIREIAAAAEMPIPTMYQYLERKEDLLFQIYKYFMADAARAVEVWRRSDAPAAIKIDGLIRAMIANFDKNNRYVKLMFQETRSLTADARQQVYELDQNYIKQISSIIDQLVQENRAGITNTELSANFLYFICVIWPLRHWTIGKFGQEEVTRAIVEFVLRGLGIAQPTAVTEPQGQ